MVQMGVEIYFDDDNNWRIIANTNGADAIRRILTTMGELLKIKNLKVRIQALIKVQMNK